MRTRKAAITKPNRDHVEDALRCSKGCRFFGAPFGKKSISVSIVKANGETAVGGKETAEDLVGHKKRRRFSLVPRARARAQHGGVPLLKKTKKGCAGSKRAHATRRVPLQKKTKRVRSAAHRYLAVRPHRRPARLACAGVQTRGRLNGFDGR